MTRRFYSIALVAALMLMNVRSAALHVHAGTHSAVDDHRHGPQSHHHHAIDHRPSAATAVGAVTADDTVVHVAIAATSAHAITLFHAAGDARLLVRGEPETVDRSPIDSRAHGPPALGPHSLRAPPIALSL